MSQPSRFPVLQLRWVEQDHTRTTAAKQESIFLFRLDTPSSDSKILFMNICCDSVERSALTRATNSTGQHKHRKKKRRHMSTALVGFQPTTPKFEQEKTVRTVNCIAAVIDLNWCSACEEFISIWMGGTQLLKCSRKGEKRVDISLGGLRPRKFKVTSVIFNITE